MAQYEKVIFRRGPAATIPLDKVPGTLLIETDTGNTYLDDTYESRVQLKDNTKLSLQGGKLSGPLEVSESFKLGSLDITETGVTSDDATLLEWQKWLGIDGIDQMLTNILGV